MEGGGREDNIRPDEGMNKIFLGLVVACAAIMVISIVVFILYAPLPTMGGKWSASMIEECKRKGGIGIGSREKTVCLKKIEIKENP